MIDGVGDCQSLGSTGSGVLLGGLRCTVFDVDSHASIEHLLENVSADGCLLWHALQVLLKGGPLF